jgi:hypothetical protein
MVYLLGFHLIVPAFMSANKTGFLNPLPRIGPPDRLFIVVFDNAGAPVAKRHDLRFMDRHVYTLCRSGTRSASQGLLKSAYPNTRHPGNIGILFYHIYYLAFDSPLIFGYKKDALSDAYIISI